MKTFTIDEAQSLLPVLESLLKRAIEGKQAAEQVESSLSELARESVAEMDAIGVQVKDLDTGLLDFPCRLDDQVVLLCWRMGEPSIEHWHAVDSGFKDRQPVDERFHRRSTSGNRPN